ncbi:MAG: acylneuraminate cytidylyltransferase family protein [Actinomycetota bacterium]|nr:acylneuraminate cytidylyltransferase family protein [Actinomycetota bacterium]
MDVVGLIPAREGSKGIPRKNLVPLAGKPLLAWTVEAASASRTLTRTVVSTDWDEAAELARQLGAEVLGRPRDLATDDTPMLAVVRHALAELGRFDVLVLLQPTSPLRRAEHVDEAVRLLLESGADSLVSVVEVPHQFRPGKLMAIADGRLVRLGSDPPDRHVGEKMYARNGPAVLALRPERLGDDLYGGDCRPYVMELLDSVDVDGPHDLELAEFLLTRSR